MVQGAGPAALGRQLGRPGPASTRQLRGLRAGGLEEQVAGGARARALDAFLHGLWIGSAEEILRPLPQGRSDRLGQAAEGTFAGASSGREIRRAARERVAPRAYAMDQVLPGRDRCVALDRGAGVG